MESIWKSEVDFKKRKSLDKDIECDTVRVITETNYSTVIIYAIYIF